MQDAEGRTLHVPLVTEGAKSRRIFWPFAGVCLSSGRSRSDPTGVDAVDLGNAQLPNARLRSAISDTWPSLTRDVANLVEAAFDPKLPSERPTLYVPRSESFAVVERTIRERTPEFINEVQLSVLPLETDSIDPPGLLYLPGAYVVPGGRFNEFYGWDSWFIQRGLIRDGCLELAESLLEQARYEVVHYGMVLNANRTYYLSRSQPPLLSQMLLELHRVDPSLPRLKTHLPALLRNYNLWVALPRLDPATDLARYRAEGEGPAEEVVLGERDASGRGHYERLVERLARARDEGIDVRRYLDKDGLLTPLAYRGDRSMREGGFDTSDRFGILSLDILRYAPVCLNTFLYIYERDVALLYTLLGETSVAEQWRRLAERRAGRIHALMWDESEGLFMDFHLESQTRSHYPFLTAFLPLWAGLATPAQAARARERLELFERAGGLMASPFRTGCQWDAPYAWAPLHLFVVGGLHRYGFESDARRVSTRLLQTVHSDFKRTGTFKEKYNAETMTSDVEGQLQYGYATNETGFGWTNAVVLELLDYLEKGRMDLPLATLEGGPS